MNACAASSKFIVICGLDNVFVIPRNPELPSSTPREIVALNLTQARTSSNDSKKSTDKVSGVCITISSDSQYICCSDSEKNVYIFKNEGNGNTWRLLSTFQAEKRLLKVEFDQLTKYLLMVDKCGDLWTSSISSASSNQIMEIEQNNKEIGTPQKVLGHCSVILDAKLTTDCRRVLTSDRDEKIRISCFPEGFIIQNYLLGHKEAVVSIEMIRNEKSLLSVDIDGICKLWDLVSNTCTQTYNLFNLLSLNSESNSKLEVNMLKVGTINNRVFIALKISHYDNVSIFELNTDSLELSLVGNVTIENSKIWDMCWIDNEIYVITLDSFKDSKKITLHVNDANTKDVKLDTSNLFEIYNLNNVEIVTDVNAFALFNNESYTIPMRKRGFGRPQQVVVTSSSSPQSKVPRLEVEQTA